MDFEHWNSGVPYPKHGIKQQVEAVAGLICEQEKPLDAIQLPSKITSTLISEQLKSDLSGARAGTAAGQRQTTRPPDMEAGVFYPEDLQFLGRLFDQAVAALPSAMQTPDNRTTIAKLILTRAVAANGRPEAFHAVSDALYLCELIRQGANPCCGV
ncbi:NolY [Bradyrhizobium yuanmingense]|uniref:NolY n=1 Tax=Bradyrhizobium yuanmingense TaxID=108015 RepID=UPI0023B8BA5C|nr:NolY [Bradyrhizobium yuanmingense]MDF0492881.1 NolY [Bradyrhizobium yuanmingense]